LLVGTSFRFFLREGMGYGKCLGFGVRGEGAGRNGERGLHKRTLEQKGPTKERERWGDGGIRGKKPSQGVSGLGEKQEKNQVTACSKAKRTFRGKRATINQKNFQRKPQRPLLKKPKKKRCLVERGKRTHEKRHVPENGNTSPFKATKRKKVAAGRDRRGGREA